MQRPCAVVACLLVVLIGACSAALPPVPTLESLDAWRAYSDALDPRLSRLQARDSTWQMGDASSTYTVWRQGDAVVAVHEAMSLGDYGERRVRYYFHAGRLRYLREEGMVLAGGSGREASLQPLERELLFATDGQLLGWINFVGGAPLQLDPLLAAGAREHALALVGSGGVPGDE